MAQCADWLTKGVGIHEAGYVAASTIWDPDGPGLQPPLLIVGGFFKHAGGVSGVAASNIAAFDGTQWMSLGTGIDPDGEVRALAVFNGELVAGGQFISAGGTPASCIARWNGTTWQPLGTGMGPPVSSSVQALTVFNGELIAGGVFFTAGGVNTPFVAAWNGVSWHGLGAGTDDVVYSLSVFNNELIAGGVFLEAGGNPANHIARWNGSVWATLGSGLTGTTVGVEPTVFSMLVMGSSLIVGGQFTTAGGQSANSVAAWNGSTWSGFGAGITGGAFPNVDGLALLGNDLYAAGFFTTAGGVPAASIARWNGSIWQSLTSGLTAAPPTGAAGYTLDVHNGELVVGGYFLNAGGLPARGLARWDGSTWLDFPGVAVTVGDIVPAADPWVATLIPWSGSMVLGGEYATTDTDLNSFSKNLTAWDGTTLREMGDPNGRVLGGTTSLVGGGGADLVVGGAFTTIDGVAANRIARHNDLVGWAPMGVGFNNTVAAVARVTGAYVAAGAFTLSGATTVNRVGVWNESTSTWSQLQGGTNGFVRTLKFYTQQDPPPFPVLRAFLVAGGDFTSAGGTAASRIAISEGSLFVGGGFSAWEPMGAGFNGSVHAIERFNGSTYAAGAFASSGGTVLNNIARWSGSAWVSVGGGTNGVVRAMTVSNGSLVVAGDFTTAGGVSAARLARWNGTSWSAIGGGADGNVHALAAFQGEVHLGGVFERVLSGAVYSPFWARFSEAGVPWIAGQPTSQTVACGGDASFSIVPAIGYEGLAHQWRKDGIAVVPGPTGTGSTIVIAGDDLAVQNAGLADEGAYDCVLSNACGATTSASALLNITGCLPGDLDGDGEFDIEDVAPFAMSLVDLAAYQQQYPNGHAMNGDMNQDAALNGRDIGLFVNCLINGGCQ